MVAVVPFHISFDKNITLHKKWSFPLKTFSVNVIWSHLLKKSLMENFIFDGVLYLHEPSEKSQIFVEFLINWSERDYFH